MRILILGGDGYLGWPTALRFSAAGHEVSVVDNFNRRRWHSEHGSASLTPIRALEERIEAWNEVSGDRVRSYVGAIEDGDFLEEVVAETLGCFLKDENDIAAFKAELPGIIRG